MNTASAIPDNEDDSVKIVEVGPRDGLQNESQLISPADRALMIKQLVDTGIHHIEVGSFVSPKWVPQMANTDQVFHALTRKAHCIYSALVPNMKGMALAIPCHPSEISIFGAASEHFSQKNINCSIDESFERFQPVMTAAKANNIPVRGYVSCVIGCPYEGYINPAKVAEVAAKMYALGCHEISLGDTIGVGTPKRTLAMLKAVKAVIPTEVLALHCHDTYGQALVNIAAGFNEGIRIIDSSVSGLGGCPYAKGASGNVATEDVLYFCKHQGINTGIDLSAVVRAGESINRLLKRSTQSKVAQALSQEPEV
jgi:hydroxymethylglutaryl-CoA lyase